MRKLIQEETQRWGEVIKRAGIQRGVNADRAIRRRATCSSTR